MADKKKEITKKKVVKKPIAEKVKSKNPPIASTKEGGLEDSSGIHINPKNKGKFTATKKRTGKSTSELAKSKNPLTRKRAVFAQNAKKWKHPKKKD